METSLEKLMGKDIHEEFKRVVFLDADFGLLVHNADGGEFYFLSRMGDRIWREIIELEDVEVVNKIPLGLTMVNNKEKGYEYLPQDPGYNSYDHELKYFGI